jgi:hypothetical protein
LFREPDGYDSVMGSPKDVNEITVFNAGKILLSYVVYYKIDNQPSLPSVIKPNRFIIPQALKKFFNQLIQRAESIDIGSDMRITIENLIKKTITPTEFVNKIKNMLNAPQPEGLIENLEKYILDIREPSNAVPNAVPNASLTASIKQTTQQTATGMQNNIKHSIILPSSLKKFFEKIRDMAKITDKNIVDKGIFDLISGKINAQTFLDTVIKVINCAAQPPGFVEQLEQLVKFAKFKYDSSNSISGNTQTNTQDALVKPDTQNAPPHS